MNGDELSKALVAEQHAPEALLLSGFAKPSEQAGTILFSLHGACQAWVSVPTGLVRNATTRGRQRCGDHTHSVVSFELHAGSNAEERALAGLLRSALDLIRAQTTSYSYRRFDQKMPPDPDERYPHDHSDSGGGGGAGGYEWGPLEEWRDNLCAVACDAKYYLETRGCKTRQCHERAAERYARCLRRCWDNRPDFLL